MKAEIIKYLNDPGQLERLYRGNKMSFKRAFNEAYPDIRDTATAQVWHERLNFEHTEVSWGTSKQFIFVVIASFLAGLVAKIPDMTGLNPEYFYPRHIGFIVFPFLMAYFAWKGRVEVSKLVVVSLLMLVSAIYMNFLPNSLQSDTLVLACIHLPLFLWSMTGFIFVNDPGNYSRRIDFLRYNGDLVVMTTLILIAGGIFSAITFGLFELINIRIEDVYVKYVGIWGLAAAPVVGTHLVQTNPELVNKVSPVIARIFTPIVLVMLVIYLGAVIYTGKDPYNDREFLLIFNLLLVGVMALILFSVAGTAKESQTKWMTLLLLTLSVVTIVVNGVALSAIVFRIAEWGFTPNRLAVLGGNTIILFNLLLVTYNLFNKLRNKPGDNNAASIIAGYLPVYAIWTLIVTFLFPVMFGFQ